MMSPAVRFFLDSPDAALALQMSGVSWRKAQILPRERISHFLEENSDVSELRHTLGSLNLFEAFGAGEKEIRHSRLLAWLLDPSGTHGHGAIYLERFLRSIFASSDQAHWPEALNPADFRTTCEDDHIDLLLVNDRARFVCAIENKIHAAQGRDQLRSYRLRLEAKYPDWRNIFVFLTLRDESPDDPKWIPYRLGHLVRELVTTETRRADPGEVLRILFTDYASWIRAKGGVGGSDFLRAMHLERHELRHSDFLAWLLNVNGPHGLGTTFVHHLVRLIARAGNPTLPPNTERFDWSDLEVRREFANIDLLLLSERNRIAIVIENKIRAQERAQQLGDYHSFVRRHFAHDHLVLVLLDMQGRTSETKDAVSVCYGDLSPFFDDWLSAHPCSPRPSTDVFIEQYALFLETKLWIRQKTTWAPPSTVAGLVERIGQTSGAEVGSCLREISEWKAQVVAQLGTWLLEEAVHAFGSEVAVCHQRTWFTFVPSEYDSLAPLRTQGGDPEAAFDNRILIYQFFVIPFGDAISVRPPQLALDVKLLAARPSGEGLKQHLHTRAKELALFNRVRGERPAKFDLLLNHELLRADEIAHATQDELKMKLKHRIERFRGGIHREIVAFMQREIADFNGSFE